MANTDIKNIGNLVYHASVLSGLTVGYGIIMKKFLKIDIGDPSKAGVEDWIKLALTVSVAEGTREWLVKSGIIPENIIKSI
jgi:hypothetical protein